MMRLDFAQSLPLIHSEYESARFDPDSGLPPEALQAHIRYWMQDHRDLPTPLVFSGALAQLLDHCQIEINPHTPFSGKFNHGVIYRKDSASSGILEQLVNEYYRNALAAGSPKAWEARQQAWQCGATCPDLDVWHVCPDWARLLRLGVYGVRMELLRQRDALASAAALTEKQAVFYQSALEAYDALMRLMARLRDAARAQGAEDYAGALEHLLHAAPETLYQALVLTRVYLNAVETTKERARTYGAVDQLWYSFYRHDLDAGVLTETEAVELIRYFLIQTAAEQRFADQPMCLGTVYPDGSEGNTDFAMLILEAYDTLAIHNPKIHIRCAKNMNQALLTKVLDMIRRGHSSIVLLNDEAVYAAYERIGIPRSLSVGYLPIGCYEPVLPDVEDARICSAWLNLSKPAELALTGGENILTDTPAFGLPTPKALPTFDSYMDAFYAQLRHLVRFSCDVLDGLYASQELAYAAPLLSGTVESCTRRGLDVFQNGMDIRNLSIKCFAIGTAVDSVLAVKEWIYEKHAVTVDEMISILRDNWTGAESLRQQIMRSRRKWGNHVAEADELAKSIYDVIWEEVKDRPTANGGRYRIGCDSVAQADYGHRVGALPNGRLAHTLLSKNMRPTTGMEREGVTALMQSVASLDASRFADAAPLDFWLHPTVVSGDEGLIKFAGLVNSFFAMGGFALHGNVLDAQTLIDAQQHPEEHRQLQIRVCGWNEYFVNLSKELQDDFIARSLGIEAS